MSTGRAQTDSSVFTASENTFTTSTDLTIHNLTNDTVSLKIHNHWGETVADIFDSLILSGTVSIVFTADTLPDGIYIPVLSINDENHVLKLLKEQNITGQSRIKKNATAIKVYPNPVTDLITILTDSEISGIEIYDLNGKRLFKSITGQDRIIDLKDFDRGLYLIHLNSNERTYIKKIIKK